MNTATHALVILSASALIAVGHDSKAADFDYKTLAGKWTVLSSRDERSFICEEADKLTIEGDRLTHWSMSGTKKREYKIIQSHSGKEFFDIHEEKTNYSSEFQFVWDDKGKRILMEEEWSAPVLRVFLPDEDLTGFEKIKCRKDDNIPSTRSKNPENLIRLNETFFEKILGDLNHDGEDDAVIITKQTWKDMFFVSHYNSNDLDRNRRGLLIAFKEKDGFRTFLANHDCFSSENEDGGVYYASQLYIQIKKGNLVIGDGHGRYGWRQYIFRYRNNNFYWIGYEHYEPAHYNNGIDEISSINFVTRKKKIRKIKIYDENNNPLPEYDRDTEDGNTEETWRSIKLSDGLIQKFEDTWQDIKLPKGLIKLTDITDFDELYPQIESEQ